MLQKAELGGVGHIRHFDVLGKYGNCFVANVFLPPEFFVEESFSFPSSEFRRSFIQLNGLETSLSCVKLCVKMIRESCTATCFLRPARRKFVVESSEKICLYFVCACRVVCDPARGADGSLGARRRFSRRRRRRGELARVFWPRRLRLLFLTRKPGRRRGGWKKIRRRSSGRVAATATPADRRGETAAAAVRS